MCFTALAKMPADSFCAAHGAVHGSMLEVLLLLEMHFVDCSTVCLQPGRDLSNDGLLICGVLLYFSA